jgi:hypothetical protein
VTRIVMGEIVVEAFKVLGALSTILLILGGLLRSRPLLVLGASLLGSVILTWVLGLLGLPIGIVFGFLGTGAFFAGRKEGPPEGPKAPPEP